jgi:C4-dicarboxylate-specific signal transduction histidine kinase
MNDHWENMARQGSRFFGKMTASLSHEIKNALAIINEKAGLLEDFTLMAAQGREMDPKRLKSLAGDIMKQIQRADGLVKRLNRFAHSADEWVRTVELEEALALILSIAHRPASMREAVLEAEPASTPLQVTTKPFLLENMIWACIEFFLSENQKRIRLIPEKTSDGVRIRFVGDLPLPESSGLLFPGEAEKVLLRALGAELRMKPATGEMVLHLPKGP